MMVLSSYAEVLRLCGCAVMAAVCLFVLRGLDKNGITGVVSVCIGCAFALTAILAAKPVLQMLRSLGDTYLGNTRSSLLLRAMAIGITVQLTADAVRDVGEGTLADRVETVGRVVLLCIGIPLYEELFALAAQLFGM